MKSVLNFAVVITILSAAFFTSCTKEEVVITPTPTPALTADKNIMALMARNVQSQDSTGVLACFKLTYPVKLQLTSGIVTTNDDSDLKKYANEGKVSDFIYPFSMKSNSNGMLYNIVNRDAFITTMNTCK
jgi:hypothetical protein